MISGDSIAASKKSADFLALEKEAGQDRLSLFSNLVRVNEVASFRVFRKNNPASTLFLSYIVTPTLGKANRNLKKAEKKRKKADQKLETQSQAEMNRVETEDKPDSETSGGKSEACYQVNDFNCS